MKVLRSTSYMLISVAFSALYNVSDASASLYYLSNSGDDSNSGSSSQPIKSFWRAMQILQPGDELIVQPGTYYRDTNAFNVVTGGTAAAPIVIKGNPASRPVIVGNAQGSAIWINAPYVDLSGFDATDGVQNINSGIQISNTHHVYVHNNIGHDSGCSGIQSSGSDYVQIKNNVVYNNSGSSPNQCSGISMGFGHAYDNASGYHNVIVGNTAYKNQNKTLVISGVHAGFTTDGSGIIIDTMNGPGYTGMPTLVTDNVSFNNGGSGIRVFLSNNVVVENNTTWGNNQDPNAYGTYHGEIYFHSTNKGYIYNNVAVATSTPAAGTASSLVDVNSAGDTYDYNCTVGPMVTGFLATPTWGSHNMTADPLFVAASADPMVADFSLQPTSPAVGAGSPAWAPYWLLGLVQGAPVNMGAY